MPEQVRFTVEMSPDEAWELVQFVKRVQWEHFRYYGVDEEEAAVIRDAATKLEQALDKAGYRPR